MIEACSGKDRVRHHDLGYAARLGFRVLKEAYLVADFGAATFTFG
jgi:hypothetical protein